MILSSANGGVLSSASRLAADAEHVLVYDIVRRHLLRFRRVDWSIRDDLSLPTYAPAVGMASVDGGVLVAGPPPFGDLAPKGFVCGEVGRVSWKGRVESCGFSLGQEERALTTMSFSGHLTGTASSGRYAATFWGVDSIFLVDSRSKDVGVLPLGTPRDRRVSSDSAARCGAPRDLESRFCYETGKTSTASVEWVDANLAVFFVARGTDPAAFEMSILSGGTGEVRSTHGIPVPVTSPYDTLQTASDGRDHLYLLVTNFAGNPGGKARLVPGVDMKQRLFEAAVPPVR